MKHCESTPQLTGLTGEGDQPGVPTAPRAEDAADSVVAERREAGDIPVETHLGGTALQETTDAEAVDEPETREGFLSKAPVHKTDTGQEFVYLVTFPAAAVPSDPDDKPRKPQARRRTPKES